MVLQKHTPAIALALLFAFPVAPKVLAASPNPVLLAQTPANPSAFPLPSAVPSGTTVRIDGSTSMIVINETLKQRFEARYSGSQVALQNQGTEAALQALEDGGIDLAAIGRPLTAAERAAGFIEVPISREKIAIIVGPDNPFNGNLTFAQFAQLFRGEITNWSQLGGAPGAIRFIDRPDLSDTRQALSNYQVFKTAPFETGSNTTQVAEDDTTAVIEALGQDGIGYAIASQVLGQTNVKVVRMHSTLPDDPRYPFSQPRSYVYFKTPSPTAQAFLGFATAPEGQAAVTEAKAAEAEAVAAGEAVTTTPEGASTVTTTGVGLAGLGSGLLAFSPDGQAIAGAHGEAVDLWNLTGNSLGQLRHGADVTSVAYSPNGDGLLTAGEDGKLRLWTAQGEPVGEPLEAHTGAFRAMFSPDGQTIASASEEGTIRLWSAVGQPIGEPFETGGDVAAIAFSPNGQTIATAGDDTIHLWNLQGKPAAEPIQAEGDFTSLAFSPDGQSMIAAGENGTIRQWDLQGNPIGEPIQAEGDLTSLAFSPDGQTILAAGEDGTLRQWDLQGNPIGATFEGEETIAAAAFSPDGQTIAGVNENGVVTLLNAQGDPVGQPFGGAEATRGAKGLPLWLWLLLPLALLALLLWWLSKRQATPATTEASPLSKTEVSPSPSTTEAATPMTEESELATRAGSVIASDRMSIADNRATPITPPTTPTESPSMASGAELSPTEAAIAGGAALAAGAGVLPLLARLAPRHDSQFELVPYSPNQVQARWQLSPEQGAIARQQGGADFGLRLYDVTDIDLSTQPPHTMQAIVADEQSQPLLLTLPTQDRNYLAEVGYATPDGQWLPLMQSNIVRMPDSFDNAPTVLATPPAPNQAPTPANLDALAAGGAALAAGLGAFAATSTPGDRDQSAVEATKFDVGQTDLSAESLADVDADLPDLPDGYGESRIVLMPRDPQWAYTYWDIPNTHKEELRHQGGERLALRLYDVTDIDLNSQRPYSVQQFDCDELARDWYLPIPVSDRDYVVEIGYLTADGRWLVLARSAPTRIPPVYPSDWSDDYFMTIQWDEDLRGKTFYTLIPPGQQAGTAPNNPLYDRIFDMAQSAEAQRVAGSLYGSMHMIPQQAISSYIFPSGVGMGALSMSGIGMSGIGFSASVPPIRPRKFWLVADAELIVYGATEPDATVTIGDRVIPLSPDGTFRFQMSFQDGIIDYPIVAVAADGEQNRAIHMEFERETPERRTNTKDEAIDEWL